MYEGWDSPGNLINDGTRTYPKTRDERIYLSTFLVQFLREQPVDIYYLYSDSSSAELDWLCCRKAAIYFPQLLLL